MSEADLSVRLKRVVVGYVLLALLAELLAPLMIVKMVLVVGLLAGVAVMTVSAVDEPRLSALTRTTKAWLLGVVVVALAHLFLGYTLYSRASSYEIRVINPIFSLGPLGRLPALFAVLVLLALAYVYRGGSQTNPEDREWIPSNSNDRE